MLYWCQIILYNVKSYNPKFLLNIFESFNVESYNIESYNIESYNIESYNIESYNVE